MAVMESGRHCGSLKDIINVTENLDRFDLQPAFTAADIRRFPRKSRPRRIRRYDEPAGGVG